MLAISLSKDEQYALLLSTLAGLSTAIGGAIAVSDTCGRLWLSLGYFCAKAGLSPTYRMPPEALRVHR